jgi:Transposase, Mutator family
LRERGVTAVRLVISDHHLGLTKAIATVMLGSAWQRTVRCWAAPSAHFLAALDPEGRDSHDAADAGADTGADHAEPFGCHGEAPRILLGTEHCGTSCAGLQIWAPVVIQVPIGPSRPSPDGFGELRTTRMTCSSEMPDGSDGRPLYELEAAIEDADRDLAAADPPDERDYRDALAWVLAVADRSRRCGSAKDATDRIHTGVRCTTVQRSGHLPGRPNPMRRDGFANPVMPVMSGPVMSNTMIP